MCDEWARGMGEEMRKGGGGDDLGECRAEAAGTGKG